MYKQQRLTHPFFLQDAQASQRNKFFLSYIKISHFQLTNQRANKIIATTSITLINVIMPPLVDRLYYIPKSDVINKPLNL